MAGTRGRSGGRNKKVKLASGDGPPMSPRALSPRAAALFSWILDKIGADTPGSQWSRVDGAVIAALAELLESQEHIASQLAGSPGDLGLMRVRLQYAAQITRMSAVVGMSPLDRKRQPTATPVEKDDDPFERIMAQMRKG